MKNVKLLGAALLSLACVAMVGCGDKKSAEKGEESAEQPTSEAAAAASAPVEVKPGEVLVAPVSKIASAPGIDPNDASTIPPMPKSAMAKPEDVKKQMEAASAAAPASAPALKK